MRNTILASTLAGLLLALAATPAAAAQDPQPCSLDSAIPATPAPVGAVSFLPFLVESEHIIAPVSEDYTVLFPALFSNDNLIVTVEVAFPTVATNPWLCETAAGVTIDPRQAPDGIVGEALNSQCFEQDGFQFGCFLEREIHGLDVGQLYMVTVRWDSSAEVKSFAILPDAA